MERRFQGQVAIVTGAARGIGEGIAERLAEEGATVVLCDALETELNRTVEGLERKGLAVTGRTLDITQEEQVRQVWDEVAESQTRIDIAVNSAGIVGPTSTSIVDYELDDFQRVLDVNLVGSFLVTKHSIRQMLPNGYGRILLISSIGGKEGNPGMVGYASSKSGVLGLVKAVGKEYATCGITVNGLAPAVIATPMNQATSPDLLKYMSDRIPMKRLGRVEEVAAIACWIVSREASFNTGFIFDISGGRATY